MTTELHLGDCLEVMKTLPAGSVDAVVTDPPYLLGSASTRRGTRPQSPMADWVNAARWYTNWLGECLRITTPRAPIWIHGNWRGLPVMEMAAQSLARRITSVLVWNKDWPGVGSMSGLRNTYEVVFLVAQPEFRVLDRTVGDIWTVPWASARPNGHPQEKPVDLAAKMLDVSNLAEHASVLDPFMGSGTTGVACLRGGWNFTGIEIDPAYFAVAKRRIEEAELQMRLPLEDR
jgi:site-specific DNA-methyltransferase (adenine-specific)